MSYHAFTPTVGFQRVRDACYKSQPNTEDRIQEKGNHTTSKKIIEKIKQIRVPVTKYEENAKMLGAEKRNACYNYTPQQREIWHSST